MTLNVSEASEYTKAIYCQIARGAMGDRAWGDSIDARKFKLLPPGARDDGHCRRCHQVLER